MYSALFAQYVGIRSICRVELQTTGSRIRVLVPLDVPLKSLGRARSADSRPALERCQPHAYFWYPVRFSSNRFGLAMIKYSENAFGFPQTDIESGALLWAVSIR